MTAVANPEEGRRDAADRGGRPPAGWRRVPHTADLRVEAWGPDRETCLAQAVRGTVAAFVDLTPARAATTTRRTRRVVVTSPRPGGPEGDAAAADLLVALLDEVVYRVDADGEVPVDVDLTAHPDGLRADLTMVEVAALPLVGAVPKAVTLHGLAVGHGPEGWHCSVTLDV